MAGTSTPIARGTKITLRLELWGQPDSRALKPKKMTAGIPNIDVSAVANASPEQGDYAIMVYAEVDAELTVNQVQELFQTYAESKAAASRAQASIEVYGDWPGKPFPTTDFAMTVFGVSVVGYFAYRLFFDPADREARRARRRVKKVEKAGAVVDSSVVEDWLRVNRNTAERIFRQMWPSKFPSSSSSSESSSKPSDPWGGFSGRSGSSPPAW